MNSTNVEKVKKFISLCESNRLSQLDEELRLNKEYTAISEQAEALYDELKNAIPESLVPVLNKYENLLSDMMFTRQHFYYKNGFIDAAIMLESLFESRKDIKLDIKFF